MNSSCIATARNPTILLLTRKVRSKNRQFDGICRGGSQTRPRSTGTSCSPMRTPVILGRSVNSAFRLQSLDGTVLLPGDSGGGVWLDGKLVGNMWLSEKDYDWRIWTWKSTQPATRYVGTSIAAQLPAGIQSALPQDEPTIVEADYTDDALMDW